MLTRRIGEACDAAQKLPELRQPSRPVTLMVRFDTVRQKLSNAMQFGSPVTGSGLHRLYTSTWPLMVTSVGFRPNPATSV